MLTLSQRLQRIFYEVDEKTGAELEPIVGRLTLGGHLVM